MTNNFVLWVGGCPVHFSLFVFLFFLNHFLGNSLVVQWLGLYAFTNKGAGSTLVGELRSRLARISPLFPPPPKKDHCWILSSKAELYVLHTSDAQPSKLYQSQCFQTVPKVPCGIKLPQFKIKVDFFFLAALGLLCGLQALHCCAWAQQLQHGRWDLNSWTRDQTHILCNARQVLNLCTTREVPKIL